MRLRSSFALAFAAGALTLTASSVSQAQQPDVDMDYVHKAFWEMKGSSTTEALQWFEQEVNKVYHGDRYVSIMARNVPFEGQTRVVVRGYVDMNGDHQYTPGVDKSLFAFVQQGVINGYNVKYEFLDGWNNVYYRGTRAIPQSPFYMGYYYNWRTPAPYYYTSGARLGYLRGWRVGYRGGPVYGSWRGRFGAYRAGYGVRIGGLRTGYGVPRAGLYSHPTYRSRFVVRRR